MDSVRKYVSLLILKLGFITSAVAQEETGPISVSEGSLIDLYAQLIGIQINSSSAFWGTTAAFIGLWAGAYGAIKFAIYFIDEGLDNVSFTDLSMSEVMLGGDGGPYSNGGRNIALIISLTIVVAGMAANGSMVEGFNPIQTYQQLALAALGALALGAGIFVLGLVVAAIGLGSWFGLGAARGGRAVAAQAGVTTDNIPGLGGLPDGVRGWRGDEEEGRQIEERIQSFESQLNAIMNEEEDELGSARDELEEAIEELENVKDNLDPDEGNLLNAVDVRLKRADAWMRAADEFIKGKIRDADSAFDGVGEGDGNRTLQNFEQGTAYFSYDNIVDNYTNYDWPGGNYGLVNVAGDLNDTLQILKQRIVPEEAEEDHELHDATERLTDAADTLEILYRSMYQLEEDIEDIRESLEEFEVRIDEESGSQVHSERWEQLMETADEEMELDEKLEAHLERIREEMQQIEPMLEQAETALEELAEQDEALIDELHDIVSEDQLLGEMVEDLIDSIEADDTRDWLGGMEEFEGKDNMLVYVRDKALALGTVLENFGDDLEDQERREKEIIERLRGVIEEFN